MSFGVISLSTWDGEFHLRMPSDPWIWLPELSRFDLSTQIMEEKIPTVPAGDLFPFLPSHAVRRRGACSELEFD